MIRFASLALVLSAMPSLAQAQTLRITFPVPRPVVVTPAPVVVTPTPVVTPAPVIVQKTVVVNQSPAPVVVQKTAVVNSSVAPVVVQKTVVVNQTPAPVLSPAPILSSGVTPVVASQPFQPLGFEVLMRNGPFGGWESAGVFPTSTQAEAFASRMELRGYQTFVRAR